MVGRGKRLNLDQMVPIARTATRESLELYEPPPAEEREQWALGEYLTDEEGIFEIYIPNEKSADAVVISRATVNRYTGDVAVEVFLNKTKQLKRTKVKN